MRYAVLGLTLAMIAVLMIACEPQAARHGTGKSAQEPLLLLDGGGKTSGPAGPVANNDRCLVCHLNYAQEAVAVVHAKAGIGCAKCHGESDAHIADESWASGGNGTAPAVMFTRDKITAFCFGCHPKEKLTPALHGAFLAAANKDATCTDCHGKHRLAKRNCKWK